MKYSETLADLGGQAIKDTEAENSDAVLRFEDVSAATLRMFTEAIYGCSLNKHLSIFNLADFSNFGHKFQLDGIEAMLCNSVNSFPFDSYAQAAYSDAATKLYKSAPIEFRDLQDAIFKYAVRNP